MLKQFDWKSFDRLNSVLSSNVCTGLARLLPKEQKKNNKFPVAGNGIAHGVKSMCWYNCRLIARLCTVFAVMAIRVLSRCRISRNRPNYNTSKPENMLIPGLTLCLAAFIGLNAGTALAEEESKPVVNIEQLKKKAVESDKNILRRVQEPDDDAGTKGYLVGDTGHFPGDFDNLTRLMESHQNPLSAITPDWLDLAIEHRTRYEAFDHGFTSAIPDSSDNQQIHQRTRFLFEINRKDPLSFTFELTDMRAPLAEYGQAGSPVFANHFDFTQLHIDMKTENFFRTGLPGKLEVGRMVMDFGEGRLIAGHRFGTLTPTFDGVQLTVGSEIKGWGLRMFGTSPVNRKATELDDFSPVTFFSGAQITNRDIAWANVDMYFFQLNEGNKLRKRNISTPGFRLFSQPTPGYFDYEIESMYQFGEVNEAHYFAHRHHGEIGYSFNTSMPLRLIYLVDYASGDPDPNKNFDFLFAKRRVEYGPTGILGVFFPSNIFSPAGIRMTLSPTPTVSFMMSHRAFWLAEKKGAFVGTGLQDTTGQAGSFIGNLFDLNLRWNPKFSYWKRMSFDIGYTHLFKGNYFDKVPDGPGSRDTNYGYTQVTFKF
ncbi:alginate export family protein [Nitrosomonas marina]|uniref:Alginate export n=1 Tax=Nitrosomonas marina TaxID=917 RepID=A0A1H8EPG6_9PROT|nr:alginate export family protein [Nitrosomonas marina]SEN21280.1 Alginate export [Nitrosomonas marina]